MPLQNRVDPFGVIFRSPARGTFMGNRGGALHDDRRQIVRPYIGHRWITCVLEFKGRHRSVMTPGRYTELFFLDEAVAFAAGHRPCAECRRQSFHAFRDAWMRRNGSERGVVLAPEIDAALHQERLDAGRRKLTYEAPLSSLPDGCFVETDGAASLVWKDGLYQWSPEAYTMRVSRTGHSSVRVLTPRPIVECFRQGYVPEVHHSLQGL